MIIKLNSQTETLLDSDCVLLFQHHEQLREDHETLLHIHCVPGPPQCVLHQYVM